jgi:hypothetical protein
MPRPVIERCCLSHLLAPGGYRIKPRAALLAAGFVLCKLLRAITLAAVFQQRLLRLLHQPLALHAIDMRVIEDGRYFFGHGALEGIGRLRLDELNA